MLHEFLIAGFGGQGVMSLGELLTYGGMEEGHEVSWMPSYGPEMRGGSASCGVIVSDEPVGCPVVSEPTCLLVMNLPSLDTFESSVVPGGIVLVNSSLIEREVTRTDVRTYRIPANDIASELGNARVAGMVMLGALLKLTGVITVETAGKVFTKVFGEKRAKLWDINKQALEAGAKLV